MSDREMAAVRAESDQGWMEFDQHRGRIKHIAENGPTRPDDIRVIKAVMYFMAGQLELKACERMEDNDV